MSLDQAAARFIVEDRVGEDEFTEWVRPHLGVMAALAARLAPAADRDDIVQDALSRAWRKWHTYDAARGTPRVWLLAIIADRARRARRRASQPFVESKAERAATEDYLDLERVVSRLPPRQRMAVDYHYYLDLSVAETALLMGCAEGTVKSTLADARKNIRQALEGSDD